MKTKVVVFLVMFMLILMSLLVDVGVGEQEDDPEQIVIKVGVVKSATITMGNSIGLWGFEKELVNYSWAVGNQNYSFDISQINGTLSATGYDSILSHYSKLNNTYDVIIISGLQDEEIIAGFPFLYPFSDIGIVKDNLEKFVEDGGGFIGHCGGGAFPTELAFNPRTWSERMDDVNSFINSNVKHYFHTGLPIVAEHGYLNRWWPPWRWFFYNPHPEYMGCSGYLYYDWLRSSGIPIHLKVRDRQHPLLRDYLNDTIFIRWGGGPSYIVSGNSYTSNLADFPWEEDFYTNTSTRINAWKFNEPFPLVKWGIAGLFELGFFPNLASWVTAWNEKWQAQE